VPVGARYCFVTQWRPVRYTSPLCGGDSPCRQPEERCEHAVRPKLTPSHSARSRSAGIVSSNQLLSEIRHSRLDEEPTEQTQALCEWIAQRPACGARPVRALWGQPRPTLTSVATSVTIWRVQRDRRGVLFAPARFPSKYDEKGGF